MQISTPPNQPTDESGVRVFGPEHRNRLQSKLACLSGILKLKVEPIRPSGFEPSWKNSTGFARFSRHAVQILKHEGKP